MLELGIVIVKRPIKNSQIPKRIQRYTPYLGRTKPTVLKTEPYAVKTKIVESDIPNQTG
jgi:hypothetical protein